MRPSFTGSLVVLLSCATAAAQSPADDTAVRSAIVTAVRARLGASAEIRVADLQVRGEIKAPVIAQLTPGARAGARVRFLLVAATAGADRLGEAEATVFASAPHLRAARPLRRGEAIGTDATVEADGDLGNIALQSLPGRDAVDGAVASRAIARDEVLTTSMLTIPALVRAGDKVVVRASAGTVYVQAVVVATQPGGVGDVIRCVNPETRKAIAARIVGLGVAEVVRAF